MTLCGWFCCPQLPWSLRSSYNALLTVAHVWGFPSLTLYSKSFSFLRGLGCFPYPHPHVIGSRKEELYQLPALNSALQVPRDGPQTQAAQKPSGEPHFSGASAGKDPRLEFLNLSALGLHFYNGKLRSHFLS